MADQPITLQLNIFNQVHVAETNFWRSRRTSEWGKRQKVGWLRSWLLVADGLVLVFQKLLIYWNFHSQPTERWTEWSEKRETIQSAAVGRMEIPHWSGKSETNGQDPSCLVSAVQAVGGVKAWGTLSWHSPVPTEHPWNAAGQPECCCWPHPCLYDHNVPVFCRLMHHVI